MKKLESSYRAYLEAQVAKGGELAASASAILVKYAPDLVKEEERDDHGRWTSGGGESSLSGGSLPPEVAAAHAGIAKMGMSPEDHQTMANYHAERAKQETAAGNYQEAKAHSEAAVAHANAVGATLAERVGQTGDIASSHVQLGGFSASVNAYGKSKDLIGSANV